MPQLRFNENGASVAPNKAGPKAGPWFPYLMLYRDDRLEERPLRRRESCQLGRRPRLQLFLKTALVLLWARITSLSWKTGL